MNMVARWHELIAFLFAAAKGRARHVWREGKLEERIDRKSVV